MFVVPAVVAPADIVNAVPAALCAVAVGINLLLEKIFFLPNFNLSLIDLSSLHPIYFPSVNKELFQEFVQEYKKNYFRR